MLKRFTSVKIAVLLLFCSSLLQSQPCNNRYSSLIYRSISWDSFSKAITTPEGEWFTAGKIIDNHGFLAAYTPKGTPLFNYQYFPVYQFNKVYFDKLTFTDIIRTNDGSFIATGIVQVDKWVALNSYSNKSGVVLKIDRYGNVLWCQLLQTSIGMWNSGFHLSAITATETVGGDLIVYIASNFGKNYPAHGRVVCYSREGKRKWSTILGTDTFDGGLYSLQTKRSVLQTKEGTLVLGDILYKTNHATRSTEAIVLHFAGINAFTGKLLWESFYDYPVGNPAAQTNITGSAEMPNGNLVFTLSEYPTPGGAKGLRIETDNRGDLQSAAVYETADSLPNQLVSVSTDINTGHQRYLFKTPLYSILAAVDNKGSLAWQKGYNHTNGRFPASCFVAGEKGYGIFMSSLSHWTMRLLLTDANGEIDCANIPAQITSTPVVLTKNVNLITVTQVPDPPGFGETPFSVQTIPNHQTVQIECEETSDCCLDVVDSTTLALIKICEGSGYSLPDGTPVSQSGTYYTRYKTRNGCDSITYYRVQVEKNPAALSLGNDICLDGLDTLQLQATAGYEAYHWMNNTASTDSVYKIAKTGTYWVNVNNSCGSKTDSLTVYAACNFPVLMPDAFSPNGDGKNDLYRVPSTNKNSFRFLRIYNRWGEIIFSSSEVTKGWNGTYRGNPLPADVYVYVVDMRGLSGKPITQTGTILLVR